MRCLPVLLVFASLTACSGAPAAPPAPAAPSPQPPPLPPAVPPPPAVVAPVAEPNEACGQIIVVAYQGAAHAAASVQRAKPAAEQRARELLAKLSSGADFATLAKAESDAPSSAPRGGIMGTFRKTDWPELHATLREPLFALGVGETTKDPIAADYGYVVLRRCPVEKAHGRHILVRYQGSKRSGPEIKRSKAEAEARAKELLSQLQHGADFAELAKSSSEDGSAERGGDIGTQGRGILAWPFEQALFALQPGQRSGIVETEYGYHLIERLPPP